MAKHRIQTPLDRVRTGAIVLASAVVVGTIGFRYLGDYTWLEALWMVGVTVSTVGFSERSQSPPSVQLFTLLMILVGMSSAVYTFSGFFQLVLEGELERVLGVRKMTRQIEKLKNHIVICGMGRIGRGLAQDLQHRGQEFVVIDNDPSRVEEASSLDFPALCGDATEESVLRDAGVDRAQSLVSALPTDAENVFITLTAREMNPDLLILALAEHERTAGKLHQAGAQKVVMPARISAMQMSRMIMHPSTADLLELVAEGSYLDLEMDELYMAKHAKLVGKTVRETEVHRTHKLLIVAVRKKDGQMIFNPDADYKFQADDIAIVMGNRSDIDAFRSLFVS